MPPDISDHPSYENTLICFVDRGYIDHVSLVRSMNGTPQITISSSGMALSEAGFEQLNRRINYNTVASVVDAIAALVAAVASLAVLFFAS